MVGCWELGSCYWTKAGAPQHHRANPYLRILVRVGHANDVSLTVLLAEWCGWRVLLFLRGSCLGLAFCPCCCVISVMIASPARFSLIKPLSATVPYPYHPPIGIPRREPRHLVLRSLVRMNRKLFPSIRRSSNAVQLQFRDRPQYPDHP